MLSNSKFCLPHYETERTGDTKPGTKQATAPAWMTKTLFGLLQILPIPESIFHGTNTV
jgi:hypothetical protein